jgi:hypothetical protein
MKRRLNSEREADKRRLKKKECTAATIENYQV